MLAGCSHAGSKLASCKEAALQKRSRPLVSVLLKLTSASLHNAVICANHGARSHKALSAQTGAPLLLVADAAALQKQCRPLISVWLKLTFS